MASLTQTEVLAIREWVGGDDVVALSDLQTRWDIHGTVHKVARSVLQTRRATVQAGPAKYSLEGDYSEDNTATLKGLDADIAALSLLIGDGEIPGEDASASASATMDRADMARTFGR